MINAVNGASSRFAHLGKFNVNFSSSSFVIRVNLLHPQPFLFLYGLSVSLRCFSILVNFYFQVFLNIKVILYVAKQLKFSFDRTRSRQLILDCFGPCECD